jgi:post-segregation antitoxin CcdA
MRMNISVPDALAEEVRQRNVPISAVCQRALRDEVDRLRRVEGADDVLVYVESEMLERFDPDETSWPGFDPAKPILTYKRHYIGGRWELGWVLDYELGDEPGDNPTDDFTPGDPNDPPVEWAREVVRRAAEEREAEPAMETITVETGDDYGITEGFVGRWLLAPERDETRTGESRWDAGVYWGVALTARGRIAVYTAHCNQLYPGVLKSYDTFADATKILPPDIAAQAASELGEDFVIMRDI